MWYALQKMLELLLFSCLAEFPKFSHPFVQHMRQKNHIVAGLTAAVDFSDFFLFSVSAKLRYTYLERSESARVRINKIGVDVYFGKIVHCSEVQNRKVTVEVDGKRSFIITLNKIFSFHPDKSDCGQNGTRIVCLATLSKENKHSPS